MLAVSIIVLIFAADNVETTPIQLGRKPHATWVVLRLKCNFLILIKTMAKAGFWLRGATGKLAGQPFRKAPMVLPSFVRLFSLPTPRLKVRRYSALS